MVLPSKINDPNNNIGPANIQTHAVTANPPIFLLGEEPTKQAFIGGAIILFGIGMILFVKPKK